MYYYKKMDENGNIVGVVCSEDYLLTNELQQEITVMEYEAILAEIPEPEPEPENTGYTITSEEIDAAYREGVDEA